MKHINDKQYKTVEIQERRVYLVLVVSVCLSVCLSVCMYVCLSDDNFGKLCHRKFIFAHAVHLQGIRVKFII